MLYSNLTTIYKSNSFVLFSSWVVCNTVLFYKISFYSNKILKNLRIHQVKSPVTGKMETLHLFLKRVKSRTLGTTDQSASPLCPVRSWNRSLWKICHEIWVTGK